MSLSFGISTASSQIVMWKLKLIAKNGSVAKFQYFNEELSAQYYYNSGCHKDASAHVP